MLCKIHKEILKLKNKMNNPIKKQAKDLNRHLTKKKIDENKIYIYIYEDIYMLNLSIKTMMWCHNTSIGIAKI